MFQYTCDNRVVANKIDMVETSISNNNRRIFAVHNNSVQCTANGHAIFALKKNVFFNFIQRGVPDCHLQHIQIHVLTTKLFSTR